MPDAQRRDRVQKTFLDGACVAQSPTLSTLRDDSQRKQQAAAWATRLLTVADSYHQRLRGLRAGAATARSQGARVTLALDVAASLPVTLGVEPAGAVDCFVNHVVKRRVYYYDTYVPGAPAVARANPSDR